VAVVVGGGGLARVERVAQVAEAKEVIKVSVLEHLARVLLRQPATYTTAISRCHHQEREEGRGATDKQTGRQEEGQPSRARARVGARQDKAHPFDQMLRQGRAPRMALKEMHDEDAEAHSMAQ